MEVWPYTVVKEPNLITNCLHPCLKPTAIVMVLPTSRVRILRKYGCTIGLDSRIAEGGLYTGDAVRCCCSMPCSCPFMGLDAVLATALLMLMERQVLQQETHLLHDLFSSCALTCKESLLSEGCEVVKTPDVYFRRYWQSHTLILPLHLETIRCI